jgi:hypothetical protein
MKKNIDKFNQLATKDDIKASEGRLGEKINDVLTAVDNITKKYSDHEIEHVSNIAAHDRMQGEINETRKVVGLKINSKTSV